MPKKLAQVIGIDESTTKTGLGVRAADGAQAYADVKNRGKKVWHDAPAFDLAKLPGMIGEVLDKLEAAGWRFDGGGSLSLSVRQHDMVLLDASDRLLMPALTWQCNAATAQVAALRAAGAERTVGRIEERFILPKLLWALEQEPELRDQVCRVMTTGDYVSYMLTGQCRLSTSDAISNGLLAQSNKKLATAVMNKAGVNPEWFPRVISSGRAVGAVSSSAASSRAWKQLAARLEGWQVVAGLGDNHATGVGCGGLTDDETIVVSAGTSGTINRRVKTELRLRGAAACFEFYDDRMLLMMLPDCAAWYERFVKKFGGGKTYKALNKLAEKARLDRVRRVAHTPGSMPIGRREQFPAEWAKMSLGERTASTQLSIIAELLMRAKAMLVEAADAPPIKRYVLTGGLSQSPYFQQAFAAGITAIAPGAAVFVSAADDELSYQTAAYGALINALLPGRNGDLAAVCGELCPLAPCAQAAGDRHAALARILGEWTAG